MERIGVIHPHYIVCHCLSKTEEQTMKYLHTREEIIDLAVALYKEQPSDQLYKVIELLQQSEDKTRQHHFKKVA